MNATDLSFYLLSGNQEMEANDITGQIVDAAMKVHTALGPGLLESAQLTIGSSLN